MSGTVLCRLEDIGDGDSAGFTVDRAGDQVALLAVRQGAAVHVYVNSCPHVGLPLDFQPGRFLNSRRDLIQCATHGALFRIDDGACVAGPCPGQSLEAVPARIENGRVIIV